jgi:hypothetical protein
MADKTRDVEAADGGVNDAVMVIGAFTAGATGGLLLRVSTSGQGRETHTTALATRRQLHDALDEWLDAIGAEAGLPESSAE